MSVDSCLLTCEAKTLLYFNFFSQRTLISLYRKRLVKRIVFVSLATRHNRLSRPSVLAPLVLYSSPPFQSVVVSQIVGKIKNFI